MNIKMADRHENKELPIFLLFASARGLLIESDSIEKRKPPEPDILCNVTGEGPVAFEMVELIDQNKIAKPVSDQWTLIDRLRDGHRSLPAEMKAEFDRRFGNAWVEAKMRPSISLNRREKIADGIIEHMMTLNPDFEGAFSVKEKRVEVASVRVKRRDGLIGSHFKVPATDCYDPIPLDRLRAKFEKNYISSVPIELLAYYHTQAAPLEQQLRKLFSFVESHLVGSRFRRVWIFSVSDHRICFSVGGPSHEASRL